MKQTVRRDDRALTPEAADFCLKIEKDLLDTLSKMNLFFGGTGTPRKVACGAVFEAKKEILADTKSRQLGQDLDR